MLHAVRHKAVWTALACAAVLGATARAQMPDSPPAPGPQPSAPSESIIAVILPADEPPLPAPTPERPPPYVLPPVGAASLPEFADPLLDRVDSPFPGWYFDAESSAVAVHLRNQLTSPVTISSTRTDIVHFEGNRLDWADTPRFELGYRLPDGMGSIQLSYRFLATEGSDGLTNGFGNASQNGRLALNIVDVDYLVREYSLGPDWEMRWGIGFRFANLFFDSRVNYAQPTGDVLAQSEANSLWTYNAHALVEVDRKLPIPGLAFFARAEGSGGWAEIRQTFTETVSGAGPGGGALFAQSQGENQVGVPTLSEQVGLSYTVPSWNFSRFLIGYQYETWWQVGRMNDSRAQLDDQGVFLRFELNF
jgi:hypothetical protein